MDLGYTACTPHARRHSSRCDPDATRSSAKSSCSVSDWWRTPHTRGVEMARTVLAQTAPPSKTPVAPLPSSRCGGGRDAERAKSKADLAANGGGPTAADTNENQESDSSTRHQGGVSDATRTAPHDRAVALLRGPRSSPVSHRA